MAYAYIWPTTIPQKPNTNYSESSGVLVIRTPMDAGPAKMRRRGKRTETLQVSFDMSTEQVDTLDAFIKNTLRGTARFGFPHPRLETVVEARIVPQSDGALYSIDYILPDYWRVAMQLEILP